MQVLSAIVLCHAAALAYLLLLPQVMVCTSPWMSAAPGCCLP